MLNPHYIFVNTKLRPLIQRTGNSKLKLKHFKRRLITYLMKKPTIYFLCTGNSCRSQMAEGFARHLAAEKVNVYSAGIEAHGLNPLAVKVMAEAGIDISNQTSDLINQEILNNSDYVITLCGDANDKCPITPPGVRREHWNLPDPAKAVGNEEEIMTLFRQVRDEIAAKVKDLIQKI